MFFSRKTNTDAPSVTLDLDAGRRAFLRTAGLTVAGTAVLAGGIPEMAEAATLTDADILNFALNLEYLEAEFYIRAATGKGLARKDVTGKGGIGAVSGGRKVDFDTKVIGEYAREIAGDEVAHVRFLRAGLGSARVARPAIDLNAAFTNAARAAGLIKKGQRFDAFASEDNFLLAAFIFEDVGVTAYKGAARFLANKDFLEAAAGILAVEAYHAGEIRTLLLQKGFVAQAKAISDLRDAVDGSKGLDQGIRLGGRANIVPTDNNGIAFSRSPAQVLKIVYLGGEKRGGFFPRGLNGSLA